MADLELSIALDRYDRHMPFFDGTAQPPPGLRLKVFQVGQSDVLRDGTDRHARMLKGEFDVAEFSMSSYLMARDRGLPITAVPVFPRRLFSASGMFVRKDSDLVEPRQLIGKRVALSSFQTTLSLLAKGDLKFEYATPWEDVRWFVSSSEKIAFEPKPGVSVTRLPKGADLGALLDSGEIDCMFMPHPPHSIMSGRVPARRLFPDTRAEELRYYRSVGYYPIMHVLALREETARAHPWIGRALMEVHAQAMRIARSYYDDPNWSRLVWGRHDFEGEREALGDPWRVGFSANRANLERFILYSFDQGLIGEKLPPERLFVEDCLTT